MRDAARLVRLVGRGEIDHRGAVAAARRERRRLPTHVEDVQPGLHDLWGAAVVHRQADDLDAGEAGLHVDEQGRIGTVEPVDGLRRIADEEQVVASGAEQVDEPVLERIQVLRLVDEHVAVAPAERIGEVGGVLQLADRVGEHVVEVDHAPAALELLVGGVRRGAGLDAGRGPALRAPGDGRVLGRADAACRGPVDLAEEVVEAAAVAGVDRVGEQSAAVGHDGLRATIGVGPAVLEDAEHHRVECAGVDPFTDPRAVEPAAQLTRGLSGEGQHERVPGFGGTGEDAVGDAARQHPGLARSGAGDDGDEAGFGGDGSTLIGVEVVEQRIRIDRGIHDAIHPVMVRRFPAPPDPARPPPANRGVVSGRRGRTCVLVSHPPGSMWRMTNTVDTDPDTNGTDIATARLVEPSPAVSPEELLIAAKPFSNYAAKDDEVFRVVSDFAPAGDQPAAIEALAAGIDAGERFQTLLGITGSGKSATIAWTIEKTQRPTLILAPNKSLAAQLAQEMREFFPNNRVEYFVSYYDYYQPEAYIPSSDTYIEKDSSINDEIDRLRHSTTAALLTRRDVIVVASVSCIYGMGNPEEYRGNLLDLNVGIDYDMRNILRRLVDMQYDRNDMTLGRGNFRVRGDTIEVHPAYEESVLRIEMFGDTIDRITTIDPLTGEQLSEMQRAHVFPATHYVTGNERMAVAMGKIEAELQVRLKEFEENDKLLEAQRLRMRTSYDLEMMGELGYCNGIENYSMHIDGRSYGEPPFTLLDYFPDDYLLVIDESHVAVPQLHGQFAGDRSRKDMLVDHGFRLRRRATTGRSRSKRCSNG